MEEEKDKKTYEIALLLKSEDDAARVTDFIRQHNAEIAAEPRLKKLALAYKIKGNTEAVFASCTIKAAGADAKQLERDLGMREEVIRFLVLLVSSRGGEQPARPREPFTMPRRGGRPSAEPREPRPLAPRPLSNEALEKKLEELL